MFFLKQSASFQISLLCLLLLISFSIQQLKISDIVLSEYPSDMQLCSPTAPWIVARNTPDVILSHIHTVKGDKKYTEISKIDTSQDGTTAAILITSFDDFIYVSGHRIALHGTTSKQGVNEQARFVVIKMNITSNANEILFYHQLLFGENNTRIQVFDIEMNQNGDVLVIGAVGSNQIPQSDGFVILVGAQTPMENTSLSLGSVKWENYFHGQVVLKKITVSSSTREVFLTGNFKGIVQDKFGTALGISYSPSYFLSNRAFLAKLDLNSGKINNSTVWESTEYISTSDIIFDTNYIYVAMVLSGKVTCPNSYISNSICNQLNLVLVNRIIVAKVLRSNFEFHSVQLSSNFNISSHTAFIKSIELTPSKIFVGYTLQVFNYADTYPYTDIFDRNYLSNSSVMTFKMFEDKTGEHLGCKTMIGTNVYCFRSDDTSRSILIDIFDSNLSKIHTNFKLTSNIDVTDIDASASMLYLVGHFYLSFNSSKDAIFKYSKFVDQGFFAMIQHGCNCNNPLCHYAVCNGYLPNDFRVCNGKGSCTVKDGCKCIDQSFGTLCSDSTCFGYNSRDERQVCSGNGICKDYGVCACNTGFQKSSDCSIAECTSCNGTCIYVDTCKCNPGFTSGNCATVIANSADIELVSHPQPQDLNTIDGVHCFSVSHSKTHALITCKDNYYVISIDTLERKNFNYESNPLQFRSAIASNSGVATIFDFRSVGFRVKLLDLTSQTAKWELTNFPYEVSSLHVHSISMYEENILISGEYSESFELGDCYFQARSAASGFSVMIDAETGKCITDEIMVARISDFGVFLGRQIISQSENGIIGFDFAYGFGKGIFRTSGYLSNKQLNNCLFFIKHFHSNNVLSRHSACLFEYSDYSDKLLRSIRVKYDEVSLSFILASFPLLFDITLNATTPYINKLTSFSPSKSDVVIASFDTQGFNMIWSFQFYCSDSNPISNLAIISEDVIDGGNVVFSLYVQNCKTLSYIQNKFDASPVIKSVNEFAKCITSTCSIWFKVSKTGDLTTLDTSDSMVFIGALSNPTGYILYKLGDTQVKFEKYQPTSPVIDATVFIIIALAGALLIVIILLGTIFIILYCKRCRKATAQNPPPTSPIEIPLLKFEISYAEARPFIGNPLSTQGGEAKIHESDEENVVKVYDCTVNDLGASKSKAMNELRIITKLHDANIVPVTRIFHGEGKIGFFMSRADCNLEEYLEEHPTMSANRKLNIILGIAKGMKCLHDRNILHCDLKPQNILMYSNTPKICDFGQSINMLRESEMNAGGTVKYRAPETIRTEENTVAEFSKLSDAYSFGVVALEIINGALMHPTLISKPVEAVGCVKRENTHFYPKVFQIIEVSLRHKREERFFSFVTIVQELEKLI